MTETQKGYPYLTKGLLYRRARIAGEIEVLRRKLGELETTLERIDFTVQHFNPDATPDQLKPIKPYRRLKLFRQGELRKRVLGVLKEATAPLDCHEIAVRVIAVGGFDTHEDREIEKRVRSNVWNLLNEGRLCRLKEGKRAFFTLLKPDITTRFKIGRHRNQRLSGDNS